MSNRVSVGGYGLRTAFGPGADALLDAVWAGRPGFRPVDRFDVRGRRVATAAIGHGPHDLRTELVAAIAAAAGQAGLSRAGLAATPLMLAVHGDPALELTSAAFAADVAGRAGTGAVLRAYTSACVAASTAVAAAASLISRPGTGIDRVVVAAGYLVEADQFAVFDAARVLATDGAVRPFSAGRTGLLLGDGVAAVVLESTSRRPRAEIRGWGRSGDAYHVCRARPDGAGVARAIETALVRGGLRADEIDYVNAHGSGAGAADRAEANALAKAGVHAPVSSTKSVHGQALEASGLIELIVTIESLRHGRLPVNAGYLGPDEQCPVDVITTPREAPVVHALSLNSGFGGANTALVVGRC